MMMRPNFRVAEDVCQGVSRFLDPQRLLCHSRRVCQLLRLAPLSCTGTLFLSRQMLANPCALRCAGRPAATMAVSMRSLVMAQVRRHDPRFWSCIRSLLRASVGSLGFQPSTQAPVELGILRSSASLVQTTRSSTFVSRKRATLTVVAAAEAAGSASEDPLERYAALLSQGVIHIYIPTTTAHCPRLSAPLLQAPPLPLASSPSGMVATCKTCTVSPATDARRMHLHASPLHIGMLSMWRSTCKTRSSSTTFRIPGRCPPSTWWLALFTVASPTSWVQRLHPLTGYVVAPLLAVCCAFFAATAAQAILLLIIVVAITAITTLQPITKKEFAQISGPASMHAIGHIAANVSFAAVAISLTHTVKTLEPAFNCLLSKLVLGVGTPLPVVATLVPIMAGVALASAAELSFNWLGFLSAMASNLTFGFRAVWSKKCDG